MRRPSRVHACSRNFAFKCHRQQETQVYAVNAISFHPRWGTFATAGSDGVYTFWDKDSKQRLKMFNKYDVSREWDLR